MCMGMIVNYEGKVVFFFEVGIDKLWVVDELKGFVIVGVDGYFQWVEVVVVNGNQVVVWYKDIFYFVMVCYGWDDNLVYVNLKNRIGLLVFFFQILLEDK